MFKKISYIILCFVMLFVSACQSKDTETTNEIVNIAISVQPILAHKADLKESKEAYVPADGWLMKDTEVTIASDDTVLDVLKKVTQNKKIVIDIESGAQSGTGSAYIKGIGQIYNGDCGDMSGWMFKIDDEWADKPADQIKVKHLQKIEWVFICDYDEDVKN